MIKCDCEDQIKRVMKTGSAGAWFFPQCGSAVHRMSNWAWTRSDLVLQIHCSLRVELRVAREVRTRCVSSWVPSLLRVLDDSEVWLEEGSPVWIYRWSV